MDLVKVISIALSSLIIIVLLRKINEDYALLASCLINISICVFSFGVLIPVFDFINETASTSGQGELYGIMLKGAGVCMLSSAASELCRDLGEASLSQKIEFAGRCTLVTFCLPLIQKVFENALSFIS